MELSDTDYCTWCQAECTHEGCTRSMSEPVGRTTDEAMLTSQAGRRARTGDPGTSYEAAAAVDINNRCQEVLAVIWTLPFPYEFTDGELAARIPHMDRNVVARRRKDLEILGIVIPVFRQRGQKMEQAKRPGVHGRNELVWRPHPAERPPAHD